MGEIAARTLLKHIENPDQACAEILIEPELVVRKSTATAKQRAS
jgi:DNA-binding LacI/PurR family transcriptional regulator